MTPPSVARGSEQAAVIVALDDRMYPEGRRPG
jgi:hypothetical protein